LSGAAVPIAAQPVNGALHSTAARIAAKAFISWTLRSETTVDRAN
jgi:hypothetical protein